MPFKIKTFNAIHSSGLDLFPTEQYTISNDIERPDAIICRSASLHESIFPPSLKAIARAGIGVNNIPVSQCTDNGIVVFNTMGANANAVKELVLAGMIIASRNLTQGNAWLNTLDVSGHTVGRASGGASGHTVGQDWGTDIDTHIEKNKKDFVGFELQNKTLGIIGLGAIGHTLANLGTALSMNVIGYDPFLSIDNALQLSREVTIVKSIEDIISQSDFISLHVGYSEKTHHLINEHNLKLAKPTCVLLNFSRKHIVDEDAIISQLDSNKMHRYVSDFPSEVSIGHQKIIYFPHLGASTSESEENCSKLAATAIRRFLEYGDIQGSVNFPHCTLAPSVESKYRLLIGNKNVTNIVAQITHILGQNNINIENMINTHKDTIAYNIIDVNKKIDVAVIDEIKSIQHILFIHQLKLCL